MVELIVTWSESNLHPAQTQSWSLESSSSWIAATADLPERLKHSLCSPFSPSSLKVAGVPVREWMIVSLLAHPMTQFSFSRLLKVY